MLIIVEENYAISVWCREILDGLRSEARKKRITLNFAQDIEESLLKDDEKAVMIVGAETEWINQTAHKVKHLGKHPIILSNQHEESFGKGVSRVTDDILGSMTEIMSIFAAKGHGQIALFACNPYSASDCFKRESFLKLGGNEEDVFLNLGSLEQCFDRFYEKHEKSPYGGIVCANDFAAISLVRHLSDAEQSIKTTDIISYSDTLIAKCTFPAVSTVSASYKNFGNLAFMITDCIEKSESISEIKIMCNWEIKHRETSSPVSIISPKEDYRANEQQANFYDDPHLMEMMRIETLLSQCDETDVAIVDAILKGKTTLEIETSCFIRETAVKYRIKKMKEICNAKSRSELRTILSKYLASDISKKFPLKFD